MAIVQPIPPSRSAFPLAETDSSGRPPRVLLPSVLVLGFACAAATWSAWLILALPWLKLSPMAIGMGVLGVWMLASAWIGRTLGGKPPAVAGLTGLLGGLVTAGVNVLLLGSKLVEPANPADITQGQGVPHPDAGLAIAGFMLAGAAIGATGGIIGSIGGRSSRPADAQRWQARFALISALACAPLLLLGGAVTSTESGMAVTGWPDTFGANMFLYPISLMSEPRVFMEHAHRLFGAMVGLTILTQWILTMAVTRKGTLESILGVVIGLVPLAVTFAQGGGLRLGVAGAGVAITAILWMIVALLLRRLGPAAGALLVLVTAQGVMGGTRVTESSASLAVVHGVTGQIFVALAAVFALSSMPGFVRTNASHRMPVKATTLLAAALVLQLTFGALFRHLRREELPGASHALWSHVGFSVVVVLLAAVAGFLLAGRKTDRERPRATRVIGHGIVHSVGLQFVLGWVAFAAVHTAGSRGAVPTAEQLATAPPVPWWEALIATLHQANGALLLVLAGLGVAWSLRLGLHRRVEPRPIKI